MAGTIITKKGVALMAKLLASRQGLTFTRAAVGVGSTPSGYDPASMINLNKYKMDGEISGYTVGEEEASVVFQISSENVQEGFTITEAGLFADDEDEGEILYAYLDLTDDPQYVYARGGAIQKFAEIEFKTIIGTIENVTAAISPTVLITREQFDAGMETKVDAEGGDIANTKVSAATESTDPYPAPTAKETMKVILGKLIKFCADVKTGMCKIEDIVNNCTSTDTDKPLAAAIGKKLWDKITEAVSALTTHKTSGDHDGRYYTETEIDTKLGGKSNTGHTHDDRYYTESEMDTKLNGKASSGHTHSAATQSAAGLMSANDKKKLDGVATGANAYSHPTGNGNNHIPSGGASGQILRWSSAGTATWGSDNNTTYSAATQSAQGLMSAADKKKLDGITAGANMLKSDIVNNCTSTNTDKPLAANQGKVLMEKFNQLNSDKLDKSKLYKQLWYGEWTSGTITVHEISDYKLFMVVSSNYPIAMLGVRLWDTIHCQGTDLASQWSQRNFVATFDVSGNTLKNLETSMVDLGYNNSVSTRQTFPITHIIGLL